jgi:hypothetical protein
MPELPTSSVALVVTSPPYFAGKAYEEALGEGHIPADYVSYLEMLTEVFAECARVLEPGGRIAVNVANLGRKPYRSLSADVTSASSRIASGCCCGVRSSGRRPRRSRRQLRVGFSFQRAHQPGDPRPHERVIIASKGRFDRATQPQGQRSPSAGSRPRGRSSVTSSWRRRPIVWEIAPERASRVGHPAPFPVELPERLIHLFTYRDDLVLDPFMGSGTTGVAAVSNGAALRRGTTPIADYAAAATARVALPRATGSPTSALRSRGHPCGWCSRAPCLRRPIENEDFQVRAVREGRAARELAREALVVCGFSATSRPSVDAARVASR